ncbi:hypothetical protein EIP86_006996 [Pleurotus ostreatoroseus]|nr:hypothetical protein EIP86_006996 [Pleurotus ostreatoroseus]
MLPWGSSNGSHVSAPPTPMDSQRLSYNLVLSDTRRSTQDLEPTPEPWDIPVQSVAPISGHQPAERLDPLENLQARGRNLTSATFGRGDEDGFPALTAPSSVSSHGTQQRANLAATRPGRAYSPVALRSMFFEHVPVTSKPLGTSGSPGRLNGTQAMCRKSSSRKSKDVSPSWTRSAELTMQHAMEDDISMIMRQRVKRGYGLVNPLHNAAVVEETSVNDTVLAQLWEWIHRKQTHCACSPHSDFLQDSQKLLGVSPATLNGYNFSYQGICGIWEGFRSSRFQVSSQPTPRIPQRGLHLDVAPTPRSNLIRGAQHTRSRSRQGRRHRPGNDPQNDEFASAVTALMMEAMLERSSWKPAISTSKLPQRQLMLQLCGWSLNEEDLANAVKRFVEKYPSSWFKWFLAKPMLLGAHAIIDGALTRFRLVLDSCADMFFATCNLLKA